MIVDMFRGNQRKCANDDQYFDDIDLGKTQQLSGIGDHVVDCSSHEADPAMDTIESEQAENESYSSEQKSEECTSDDDQGYQDIKNNNKKKAQLSRESL